MESIGKTPRTQNEGDFYDWLEQGLHKSVTPAQADRLQEAAKQYGWDVREAMVQRIDADARPLLMYTLLSRCGQNIPAALRPAENLATALRSIREAAQKSDHLSTALTAFYLQFTEPEFRGHYLGYGHGPNLPLSIRAIPAIRPSFMTRAVAPYEPQDADKADRLLEKVGSTWKLHLSRLSRDDEPVDLAQLAEPTLRGMKQTLDGMLSDPNARDLLGAVEQALAKRRQEDDAFWQGVKEGVLGSLPTMGPAPKGLIAGVLRAAGLIERS